MRLTTFALAILIITMPAAAADRDAATASYRQGNGLFDHFQFADAATAYGRAIDQDPKFIDAYFNRALAEEMVDRQKATDDWRKFIEAAGDSSDYTDEVGQARARIEILGMMPAYPEGLQASRYVPSAGDYYGEVAEDSESRTWKAFPIKVSMGRVPSGEWAQGAREGFNIWKGLFPLELTPDPEEADIVFDWDSGTEDARYAGEELDWVQFRRVGNELTGRRVAYVKIDASHNWSKDEMRAIVLHELGHALGIKGHSESKGDIMYYQVQEKSHRVRIPGVIMPVAWKSLVSRPSQRDLNTLIRLYNAPGSVVRLK